MKRAGWLIILLAFVALGWVPATTDAQEVPQVPHAVVIKNDFCTFLDTTGEQTFDAPNGVEDVNSLKVITPSHNCNKNVSCHTDLGFSPGKAYVFDYDSSEHALCTVTFSYEDENIGIVSYTLTTERWHETITPKGNVSLTCHFKDCEATPPECSDGCVLQDGTCVCPD